MNILLAEDDINLGEQIVYWLKKEAGFQVEWVLEGEEAYYGAVNTPYDVVILDWMMPNGNGEAICRHLRNHGYSGPILMFTHKDIVPHRFNGSSSGADDYLVKPFEFNELLNRIHGIVRRNEPVLKRNV
jgi:DNA-binding response OmpR family regulator